MSSPAHVQIRAERPDDVDVVRRLEHAAFLGHPHHAPGQAPVEPLIVDALRDAGALTLSLVAEVNRELVGHIAFSPVVVGGPQGASNGWYGLGPVAVRPDQQRQGIGAALVQDGVRRLRSRDDSGGVVLVGEPDYYGRFGFRAEACLTYPGVPPEFFLCLPFGDGVPSGTVTYHPAFSAT